MTSSPVMRAMLFRRAGSAPAMEDVATPIPGRDELLVRVRVCGVCRTDLDIVDGRLDPSRIPVIPGHQVVGDVVARGDGNDGPAVGDRVGIAWIHWACGVCRWCIAGLENLCPQFRSTGCDVNGGYAEYVTVPHAFAHAIPPELSDAEAAPLLCAGATDTVLQNRVAVPVLRRHRCSVMVSRTRSTHASPNR